MSSSSSSSMTAAYYGILPAFASTMCCWGPPLLSMVGAATATASANSTSSTVGVGNTAVALSRQIARYRPYLLGLSATMIGYSFTKVYGLQERLSPAKHACCENNNEDDVESLKFQRVVVWTSLAVAIAGASYGRVKPPRATLFSLSGAPSMRRNDVGISSRKAMELYVNGMTCGGCANKVQTAIESVGKIHKANVDHTTGKVVVEATIDVNLESIKKAIAKAGYHVQDLKSP